ncbi:Crotonase superfamily [Syntrophomonas zehnderi OL-4]|uniref:Crotonase superfamily n=1 Tax=Syntrophomonas zehnderi OL-4 TaxID=690567 RepID=A0A0E4GEC1_9FIRM|nr:enoyl-CoA hydratase/isomerase family protein [Syntrophomonas zehnderi]CFX84029.1 Crotonase superfamily [Syntrophomonas zehnderi OL-4]
MFDCEVEDNIIIFRFNYGRTNSITLKTLQGLKTYIDQLNDDDDLKGLILTGTGRYFSSGFDLETFTTFPSEQAIIDWFKIEEEVLYHLFTCSKPVIAAINGHTTAAGMIVSMASDYRLAINNARVKVGMTEIKIGLSLTPAEADIMLYGLDSDKKYRDVVFGGNLFSPIDAVNREIFDELVDDQDELINQAKAKICNLIDTPGRPFIGLKKLQRQQRAETMRKNIDNFDMNNLVVTFTNPAILQTLNYIKQSLAG